jgi:hypothetical protein
VLTARSIGWVISVSTSLGLAPGYEVDTVSDGNSTSGRRSIANLDSENTPTTRMAMKTMKVAIGLLMAMSDKFIFLPPYPPNFYPNIFNNALMFAKLQEPRCQLQRRVRICLLQTLSC